MWAASICYLLPFWSWSSIPSPNDVVCFVSQRYNNKCKSSQANISVDLVDLLIKGWPITSANNCAWSQMCNGLGLHSGRDHSGLIQFRTKWIEVWDWCGLGVIVLLLWKMACTLVYKIIFLEKLIFKVHCTADPQLSEPLWPTTAQSLFRWVKSTPRICKRKPKKCENENILHTWGPLDSLNSPIRPIWDKTLSCGTDMLDSSRIGTQWTVLCDEGF